MAKQRTGKNFQILKLPVSQRKIVKIAVFISQPQDLTGFLLNKIKKSVTLWKCEHE